MRFTIAALVIPMLLSSYGATRADNAKLSGAVTFTGSCNYSDFGAEKKSIGPCAEKVTELAYQDGFHPFSSQW